MVLGFDGAIIRHLLIFLRRANACEVSLFATFEAFSSFAVLFLLLVVGGFPHCCGGIHCIVITRGKTWTSRLEVASSLILLVLQISVTSLFLLRATPIEIVEGIISLLPLIRSRGGLSCSIAGFERLDFQPISLLFLCGVPPLWEVLRVVLPDDNFD